MSLFKGNEFVTFFLINEVSFKGPQEKKRLLCGPQVMGSPYGKVQMFLLRMNILRDWCRIYAFFLCLNTVYSVLNKNSQKTFRMPIVHNYAAAYISASV